MNAMSPSYALTIGDPTGIGPEIFCHWLNTPQRGDLPSALKVLKVFGDIEQLEATWQQETGDTKLPQKSIWGAQLNYQDCRQDYTNENGQPLPGQTAYQAIVSAVTEIREGKHEALITGPISKRNLQTAGIPYTGHTELLQDLANELWSSSGDVPALSYQSDMLFVHEQFRMLLLTRHIPLAQVGQVLTVPYIVEAIGSLVRFLNQQAGLPTPRIGVLGVNPHAGEVGGDEEARLLLPALTILKAHFPEATFSEPLPADAAFRNFDATRPPYDAYVAAYHDQGLIPFKLLAGFHGVNVTIGLPFLRTSVSHGTAEDIVGKGVADTTSLHAATQLAVQLTASQNKRPKVTVS